MSGRDPAFWHRFSLATHQQAEIRSISDRVDTEKSDSTIVTSNPIPTTPWLSKQQKKRRRYWICYWIAMVVIMMLAGAIAGVVVYLKHSHG